MTRDYFIKNMLFSISEYNVSLETALEQTWVAGWEYHRKYDSPPHNNGRAIIEYGENDEILEWFPSASEAARKRKITRKTIWSVLNGQTGRMKNGHYFEYEEDKNRHQEGKEDDAIQG